MDFLSTQQLDLTLRVTAVIAPVVLYFLMLGILNTRRRPQLLTGRQDLAMWLLALSPLMIHPLMGWVGGGWATALACGAILAAAFLLLAPWYPAWMIYNLPLERACGLIERAVSDAGHTFQTKNDVIQIDGKASLTLSTFPVINTVSIRMDRQDPTLAVLLERSLAGRLAKQDVEPSPMGVAILLVAVAMAIAPTTLLAQQAPQLVRLFTDLVR
jgi:hypothetical protein